MAKAPAKTQKSVNSTTKRTAKNKAVSAGEEKPCRCCPDCVGKASGTMGACEDDTCRDIPPATAPGGSVLYQHPNVNQGFQYWESLANLAEALAPLVEAAIAKRVAEGKGAPPDKPQEPPPPWQTVK